LGGISTNYNTNFWSSTRDVCVVEADEYDRSFHKLSPDIAIITSMDADHLDIYGTAEAMADAFVEFAGKVKTGGTLIRKAGLDKLQQAQVTNQLTYSLDANSGTTDIYTQNLNITGGAYVFDAIIQAHTIQDVQLNMGGRHNVENALVAIAVAHLLGIDDDAIRGAVAAFAGVKRRFEYVAKQTGDKPRVFIDDYAHHPEELRALVSSARELYPQLKCSVVFQPHLFTRTRDHAAGFAEVLQMADDVVLLPIYPARELPIPGITSELIAGHMQGKQVQVLEKEQWLQYLGEAEAELLITAGAGDIDTLLPRALEILKTKMN
jgi:UDP-N-acetylmuramate--alanine ligase